jgi:glycine/D-amino acid oxidase-like deaminating enzyme
VRIGIVGGGVMGLCAAWALRRRGHGVLLCEQGPLPNPLGSSLDQHRLIRHPYGAAAGYAAMVEPAYEAWDRLFADLGAVHHVRTGTLALRSEGGGDWAEQSARVLGELEIEHHLLSRAQIGARWPFLRVEDVRDGLWLERGGVLLADRIVAGLLAWLRARGVELRERSPVRSIEAGSGPPTARLRLGGGADASAEAVEAVDAAIVAAGPWTPRLLPGMRGRVTPSRQLVAYVEPPPQHADAWRSAPMLLDVGAHGFYVVPPVAGTGLKIGDHSFSLRGEPDEDRDAGESEALAVLESARARFVDWERYRLLRGKTCFYTVERDERFIVEPLAAAGVPAPGFVMSGFSGHGFKFAALLAEGVSAALEGRVAPEALSHWASGRALRLPWDVGGSQSRR